MDSTEENLDDTQGDLCQVEPNSKYRESYTSYSCNVRNGHFQEALGNCKQMIKISKFTCYPTKWNCCALILSSGVNERLGSYEDAMKDAKDAMKMAPTASLQANSHFSLGNAYCGQAKLGKATTHFLTSLKLAKTAEDPMSMQNALGGLGVVYMLLRDYSTALHCFTRQVHVVKLQCNDPSLLAIPYHNLTQAYRKLGQTTAAARFAKLSLCQSSANKDDYTHASTLLELASEQLDNDVEDNLGKAEKIFSDMGCKQGLCRLAYRKAKLLLCYGRDDEARFMFKNVYETAKLTRDMLMQLKCCYWLSRLTTTSLADKKYPRKYAKLMQGIAPKCDCCGRMMSDKPERLNILTCFHVCHARCIAGTLNDHSFTCPAKNCGARMNTDQLVQYNILASSNQSEHSFCTT